MQALDDELDDELDDFLRKYPRLKIKLRRINSDDKQPQQVKERAEELLDELIEAKINVHSSNRIDFEPDELLIYRKAVADLFEKGITAKVFINSALLKKLRDIDGIQSHRIDDYLVGLENRYNIMNRNSISPSRLRENTDRLREVIDMSDEYLLYPPVPPPRTPISQPRSRRRYLPFSRQRRGTRRPGGGGRKTKQKRKRVQKNKKESKNRTRNRKSK